MMDFLRRLSAVALSGALAAGMACASDERRPSEETPYVISPSVVVDTMLEMARVTADDFLVDLGSGDGRIVIEAARRYRAQGYGVDYDGQLVKLATENARRAGVAERARFYEQDIFKADFDFSRATVVTMYLLPEYNALLKPRLLALRPGTRIVSHDYGIDDWPPDAQKVISVPDKPVGLKKESVIYAWTVPAKVDGHWRTRIATARGTTDVEFNLTQRYQSFTGSARLRGQDATIEDPALQGDRISFSLRADGETIRFRARVSDGRISGEVARDSAAPVAWQATRPARS